MALETATFAAGCFWGVEDLFRSVEGVKDTTVGYMGGSFEHPSYRDVCTGQTGHAEVVQVQFDPSETSYDKLLDIFWDAHDPTQLDRQGPDIGSQYRSAIFTRSDEQRAAAVKAKEALDSSGRFARPIVTRIEPASQFWRAEEYHQQYLQKRGLSSCRI